MSLQALKASLGGRLTIGSDGRLFVAPLAPPKPSGLVVPMNIYTGLNINSSNYTISYNGVVIITLAPPDWFMNFSPTISISSGTLKQPRGTSWKLDDGTTFNPTTSTTISGGTIYMIEGEGSGDSWLAFDGGLDTVYLSDNLYIAPMWSNALPPSGTTNLNVGT